MESTLQMWIVIVGVFASVTLVSVAAGNYILSRQRIRARLVDNAGFDNVDLTPAPRKFAERALRKIDDRMIGMGDAVYRSRLRMSLIRAGFFSSDAPKIYVLSRSVSTIGLPMAAYIVRQFVAFPLPGSSNLLYYSFFVVMGYLIPAALLSHIQGRMLDTYRNIFPDLLDLMVVCMDAGLGINAAIDRVGREIASRSRPFAQNIEMLGAEVRAGRSLPDALDNLSARLNLDEARAFGTLLKQSLELGVDSAESLRIYAAEMRDKRLMRAEEIANVLPIKMLFPLGLFIFPVILIVALTPPMIRIFAAFKQMAQP